jgi:Zn finger protein HypA/HybF involved in hydrogenase expression
MSECEHCHKTFTSQRNLKLHQGTTLRCLKLQNNTPSICFICGDCNKNYTTSQMLDRHCKTCVKKYQRIIQEHEAEINRLTAIIEDNDFDHLL